MSTGDPLRSVSIVGIGQIPVQKQNRQLLKEMGAEVLRLAMEDASVDRVDALFAGNMLSDELQQQKHIATLIASEAKLRGIEALQVRAATATGAAALRMAYFAVASGEARLAAAVGVEKMSEGLATPALAKALDAKTETARGATLLSQNALLMQLYMDRYGVSVDDFNFFSLNAHRNARSNPNALFKDKKVYESIIRNSPVISPPLRLYDASPICDVAVTRPAPTPTIRLKFLALAWLLIGSASKIETTRFISLPRPTRPTRHFERPMFTVTTSIFLRYMMPSASWLACC
jgi:acetyl-CoA C-acetyltransferase